LTISQDIINSFKSRIVYISPGLNFFNSKEQYNVTRDYILKKKKYCKSFFLSAFFCCLSAVILVSANFLSCSEPVKRENPGLRFALISNTFSDSPYNGPEREVAYVINNINEDNPLFLVHLGGLVCGGNKWQGVSSSNIRRQYKEIFSVFSALSPILYSVKCESELFHGEEEYYVKYSKRKPYYSFYYGHINFLVIDSAYGVSGTSISAEELQWMKKELEYSRSSEAVMIFMCNPLFVPEKYASFDSVIRCGNYEALHKIFREYKVKAVFSGSGAKYFRMNVDGIDYINTGCSGFGQGRLSRYSYQYYLIDYKSGDISVIPRHVKY
jgi:hypothetical protein